VTVALSARYAMERLAADIGISKGAAVERLLYWLMSGNALVLE